MSCTVVNGVFSASFKYESFEGKKNGRYYIEMIGTSLSELM